MSRQLLSNDHNSLGVDDPLNGSDSDPSLHPLDKHESILAFKALISGLPKIERQNQQVKHMRTVIETFQYLQLLVETCGGKLPSAFISSISCFLCKSPELIHRFFTDHATLHLFHNFFSKHDRLHMIFAIMPSLTPQLVDVLLDNEDLHALLCLSSDDVSETDKANVFMQLVTITPAPLKHIPFQDRYQFNYLTDEALKSARVTSNDPANPHRLSFGRHTTNWTRCVEAVSSVEWDEKERSGRMGHYAWITLLVVLAASEDVDLSTAAVTLFQRECGLNTKQAQTILFSTPPPFPSESDWPLPISDALTLSGSLCAAVASIIPQHYTPEMDYRGVNELFRQITIVVMSCLVPALHASHPSISSLFPFFSAELRTEQAQSLWRIATEPSTPHPLISLSKQISLSAGTFQYIDDYKGDLPKCVYHRLILNDIHVLPFVSDDTKCYLIGRIGKTLRIVRWLPYASIWFVLNAVLDIVLFDSPLTHRSIIQATYQIVDDFRSNGWRYSEYVELIPRSEETIRAQMATTEKEVKWNLFIRLWMMQSLSHEERQHFFLLAETDTQMDFALPRVGFLSSVEGNCAVWAEEESANRLIEVAGRSLESDLSVRAWAIIGEELHPLKPSIGGCADAKMMERNKKVADLILRTLTVAVQRDDGKREGSLFSFSQNVSFVIETCVTLFKQYVDETTFDLAPFIPVFASLCRTGNLKWMHILLQIFDRIEILTQNTSTPFSIHSYSILFSPNHDHPAEPLTLIHIISSVLLSHLVKETETSSVLDHCLIVPGQTR
ncbi:hypothetical protein BLNAU_7721 [Blattamonas nauphoetae]|uniref:Uncharacterized protein n=1 Tax=Blattamonas nauphoetae TaxID=2049346 RepID=A0ABQ9Y0S6_9EUKA|nr:hypothetical protein BLNAU_7721 [Blattamonas nauphoetae]